MPPYPQPSTSVKPSTIDLDQTDCSVSYSFNNSIAKPEPKKTREQKALAKANNKNDEEKQSQAGDPIYHTISSEKGSLKALGRNCISLENLRTLTIKNDLNNYGNNLLQNNEPAFGGRSSSSGYYILPSFPPPTNYHPYFSHKVPPYMFAAPVQHAPMPPQYFQPNYRMPPFTNYGGYANPNPYMNLSNTNSRQSIGNESDDYRKYRDVAL